MKNNRAFVQAYQAGIQFLEKAQQKNGSFQSCTCSSIRMQGKQEISPTPFFTYCIVQAVGSLLSKEVQTKALGYILSERGKNGTYNYWERKSDRFNSEPYPDDLDDTACAISARLLLGDALSGGELGTFVKALIACEKTVGGPYRTWLVSETAKAPWLDVDPVVNANIAFTLRQLDTEIPQLSEYLKSIRETLSPYYAPRTLLRYCLVRAGVPQDLKIQVDGTILEQALSLAAFLKNGGESGDCTEGLMTLVQLQAKDGGWSLDPYITGDGKHWTGSRAYTTAICCEALFLYLQSNRQVTKVEKEPEQSILVHQRLSEIIQTWPVSVQKAGREYVHTFLQSIDGASIAALPIAFNAALPKKDQQSSKIVIELAAATVAGWIAYTLIDDVCDGDNSPNILPFAQLFLQIVTRTYYSISPEGWITSFYSQVMNRLNAAYAWELSAARSIDRKDLPDWGRGEQLAARSFGHALGPLACLCLAGYKQDSPEVVQTQEWFTQYLIARQLTDDMHDWREDLERDILTAVTTRLVQVWHLEYTTSPSTADSSQLSLLFWQQVAPDMAVKILQHCKHAKRAANISVLRQQGLLKKELSRLENSAKAALAERKRVKDFTEIF